MVNRLTESMRAAMRDKSKSSGAGGEEEVAASTILLPYKKPPVVTEYTSSEMQRNYKAEMRQTIRVCVCWKTI